MADLYHIDYVYKKENRTREQALKQFLSALFYDTIIV